MLQSEKLNKIIPHVPVLCSERLHIEQEEEQSTED